MQTNFLSFYFIEIFIFKTMHPCPPAEIQAYILSTLSLLILAKLLHLHDPGMTRFIVSKLLCWHNTQLVLNLIIIRKSLCVILMSLGCLPLRMSHAPGLWPWRQWWQWRQRRLWWRQAYLMVSIFLFIRGFIGKPLQENVRYAEVTLPWCHPGEAKT